MKYKNLLYTLFIFLICSCNSSDSSDSWPENEKEAFIKNCATTAGSNIPNAEDYCSCMLKKVIKKYPTPEDALKMDVEWMMSEAKNCM
ncbi:MAG: hypothetical protein CL846_01890 [Crocinitomicaceae bacterium]|nr:hypothetical protein [Crocinitomicaceae bacterium]|tara:strand:- start:3712 stop:3975 length:264 start_codon:yes stop_codon:yes gene_type:complete